MWVLGDRNYWKCKNGHALGVIERVDVKENDCERRVTRLLLFRQAIDVHDAAEADVIATVEGTTWDICCSVPGCGEKRTWWVGKQSMNRLLVKMGVQGVEA